MPSRRKHEPSTFAVRGGFTLIEMIVVVSILVLLAAIAVPRFMKNDRRVLQGATDEVADMLTVFAQREAVGQKPATLEYVASSHQLVLSVLDVDPDRPKEPPTWRVDVLARPLALPEDVEIRDVYVDGRMLRASDWTITTGPGQERPSLQINLQLGREQTSLVLLPTAITPRQPENEPAGVVVRQPIDLDSAGRTRQDW